MIIVGAGLAGLIAANYFSRYDPIVYDIQSNLPNNHKALLRFRSDTVSKSLKIPFKKVLVRKALVHGSDFLDIPNPYVANQYSMKVTGKILDRSIWDLSPVHRYIAPSNFIQQLAKGVDIRYSTNYQFDDYDVPVISTIPMPVLCKKLWKNYPWFDKKPIWSLNFDLVDSDIDIYQTIYFSDFEKPYYRASITGNKFTIEFIADIEPDTDGMTEIAHEVLDYFGILKDMFLYENMDYKKQEYGKIVPIDEGFRNEFIYTMTRDNNIYSLGRFATWRQILLDDLISDLETIEELISVEDRRKLYHQNLKVAQKGKPID